MVQTDGSATISGLSLQGTVKFGVVATDASGHRSEATVKVFIVDSAHVVTLTVSKPRKEVDASLSQLKR